MSGRERIGYAGIAGLLLFGFGFVGARHLRKPAPITIQNVPSLTQPPVQRSQSLPELVVVHVAGAVKHPGVVRMPSGARVVDAIHAAGGPAKDADLDSVNLAAKLVDGTQLRIPSKVAPRALPPSRHPSVAPRSSIDKSGYFAPLQVSPEYLPKPTVNSVATKPESPAPAVSTEVNLNTADLAALDSLPGVGPSTAQKILDYRQEHGSFKSIDELLAVKGIGPKKLEKMRGRLKL